MRARWGVPADVPLLVFPGGNLSLKGWGTLRAALREIRELPWTCAAVGVDVARVLLDSRGTWLARRLVALPRQDMRDALGAADLLVQPTFRDPCSLATLEALSAGVAVVTTDANGARDAIDAGCGAVVPAGDAPALAAALASWIGRVADPAERARTAEAARRATADRSAEAWLRGLRASLLDLAGRPA